MATARAAPRPPGSAYAEEVGRGWDAACRGRGAVRLSFAGLAVAAGTALVAVRARRWRVVVVAVVLVGALAVATTAGPLAGHPLGVVPQYPVGSGG